ncbi:RING finger domain-containing protein [Endozoicomonas sp. SESOKO2]|uniref:RING finger domain-containing protein n=2 Tax=unclassified Endozoicomonas TaxID=2644528 RepID=UPI0021476E7E|nr:RING finger domain-containing protein [Endozoicomonas sp. SESOKO2]
MAFLYFSKTNIQHGLFWHFLTNKKSVIGIFVFSLLAMIVVPICYSSTLIDSHHPDGRKFRIEINDGKTRNSTLIVTGGQPAGNADFSGVARGGFFYLPPPPWGGGGGRPSGLFEIDLTILQPVINWLMSIGKNSVSFEQQPSPARLQITRVNVDGSASEAAIPLDWLNFLDSEQLPDVDFWDTLLQRVARTCPASESLQWQLGCFKLLLERTVLKTHHGDGRQAGNEDGQPSGSRPNAGSNDATNQHHQQQEKREAPENRESKSPGEGNGSSGDGNNRKDDNGEQSKNNASTQDLELLANQLLAIIESDDPNAAFKFREMLDKLNMPQRLQVLETKGTNIRGNTITPLEAILALPRSSYEHTTHNRFIEQLLAATDNNYLMILSDDSHLMSASETIDDYIAINAFDDNALHVDKEEPAHIIDAECAVCKEQFERTSNIVKTPCNHLYHVDCLKQWLNKRQQDASIINCPTCRIELNALSKKLNDFNQLLRKYDGCHSLAIAERAVNEWNKAETGYETLYHFIQFCRHNSQASDDSQFVKILGRLVHLVTKAEIHHHGHISATFSANSRRMVTASDDGTAKIYVYQSDGPWKEEFTIHDDGPVKLASFSADSSHVLTASDDGTAKIYVRKEDGSWQEEITIRHRGPINSATFSADNSRVLTASKDGKANIHVQKEVGSWEEEGTISHDGPIDLASFSDDGSHVVTVGEDNVVKITGKSADVSWQVKIIVIHKGYVNSAIFSPDNRYVVIASDDGTAKIIGWKDDESWEEEFTISHISTDSSVISAAFSPDSRHVLTVGKDNLVKIIGKRADGSWVVKAIISHSHFIETATFSPDSRHVVTASFDKQAKIYGEKTDVLWEEEITIHHNHWVFLATFSPDSQHAVTGSYDGTAKIHNHKNDGSWEEGLTIHHTDQVSSATFSADGRFVMTSGFDGIVNIRPLTGDGSQKVEFTIRHPNPIFSASFSANSRFVMTQSFLGGFGVFGNIVSITELWKE